jgi:hypothetical protein
MKDARRYVDKFPLNLNTKPGIEKMDHLAHRLEKYLS